MTVFELATGTRALDHFKSDFSLWSAVRRGIRPQRPSHFGNVQTSDVDSFWALLQKMWSQEAIWRPSAHDVHEQLRSFHSLPACVQCDTSGLVSVNARNYFRVQCFFFALSDSPVRTLHSRTRLWKMPKSQYILLVFDNIVKGEHNYSRNWHSTLIYLTQ